ncbi:MAG TPA: DUF4136 domain-containing protein [Gammaproteobacteria bacterium]|nr:DUF4136 domain-containing protein [Gammaproteobacteria bacterium]
MRRGLFPVIMVGVAVLAACAVPIRTEFDRSVRFEGWRSFAWRAPPQADVKDPVLDSELLARRVEAAVIAELSARGYTHAESGTPDFFVTYHTVSKERLRSSPARISIGVFGGNFHTSTAVLVGSGDVDSYSEGILMLDVLDGKSGALVWRGWHEGQRITPERFGEAAVRETVAAILARFPPRHEDNP